VDPSLALFDPPYEKRYKVELLKRYTENKREEAKKKEGMQKK
jgi:hypothetical protein